MKLAHLIANLVIVAAVVSSWSCAAAQSAASAWAGEWGAFHRLGPAAPGEFRGASLSITDCAGTQCKASIVVNGPPRYAHCNAAGKLQVKSASEAVVDVGEFGYQCSITLEKTGAGSPSISATASGKNCSAFCTPGAKMAGTFPLRSASPFFGDNLQECYAGAAPARAALCTSQALSALMDQWNQLAGEVSDLEDAKLNPFAQEKDILARCDKAPQPASCLSDTFRQAMQQLDARKAAWHTAVTEPGDPAQARQKIAAIVGHYRHSFQNGDVSGDKYVTTDTLYITRASDNAIRYSLDLSFYNGHECSRDGVAVYKAGGMFVDHQVDPDVGRACYFEIIPTATGVRFGDPTGACRESDCGARGGYRGESFSFKQRVKPRR